MATFAKTTFSHSNYATFRPSYPRSLYDTILAFHRGPQNLCVDVGCGHGVVTRSLASDFSKVIGTDPSKGMVSQASSSTPAAQFPDVTFREATAENLSFLGDGSVDAVVAGQAAHWFDYSNMFPEMKRVLRKDGTLAFWGYSDPTFPRYPKATAIVHDYGYSKDSAKLGRYWSQPGRDIVEDLYRPIEPPTEDWNDITRVEYVPDTKGPRSGKGTMFLSKKLKLGEFKEYVRTWSAYHAWQEQHPDQKKKSAGGSGDVVDRMMDEMRAAEGWEDEEVEVEMEWGTGLLMARRA
ncbi:S-adenosyl-L-methionine-dependent methyltransferase [Saccharata proteae CBS 121410]|uniref:S-adenosyl-L-methionine-dependent methyltransferase n=1 Tax=Saccharata proteae CBS 121410 TaxID=1314787 RepID=A0A9P4M013_9PEZI|nr:S-adenosyl-L-methionine-dependent methyltransferase [Saccharata proteae CBS 121410]